jgi:hypothetical protein
MEQNMNNGDGNPRTLPPSTTYAEAYHLLEEIAEKLRQAGPDDIDSLIDDFRLAMAAHRICADRLIAIRRELDLENDL